MTGLEKATESCGMMVVLEGSVSTKINLRATKEEVMDAVQAHLLSGSNELLRFQTTQPDENEYCMFNPKKIMFSVFTKEFVVESGKIQPVQIIPGTPPGGNAGPRR